MARLCLASSPGMSIPLTPLCYWRRPHVWPCRRTRMRRASASCLQYSKSRARYYYYLRVGVRGDDSTSRAGPHILPRSSIATLFHAPCWPPHLALRPHVHLRVAVCLHCGYTPQAVGYMRSKHKEDQGAFLASFYNALEKGWLPLAFCSCVRRCVCVCVLTSSNSARHASFTHTCLRLPCGSFLPCCLLLFLPPTLQPHHPLRRLFRHRRR